jgi:lysophospholipase L1-like esterase
MSRARALAIASTVVLSACGGGMDDPLPDGGEARDAGELNDGGVPDAGMPDAGPADAGPTVHFIGRFDTTDPAGPRFAWPGSAITARFTGTGIAGTFEDDGTNLLDVIVDDRPATVVRMVSGVSQLLASGLDAGEHQLTLVKRTESFLGTLQLRGLSPVGGALVPSPFPFTRRIEFVGDSITCGYGNLGADFSCSFSADTENENAAWGAIAARALNAAHTAIAYSGKGVYRNYGGAAGDLMPALWRRTLAQQSSSTWDYSRYTPDVVVVNLGTNDFSIGDPGQAFVNAYAGFLRELRGTYPAAHLVCAMGPMENSPEYATRVQAAIAQVNDARTSVLTLTPQDCAQSCGCDYHPSELTHQRMASQLVQHLRTTLGW